MFDAEPGVPIDEAVAGDPMLGRNWGVRVSVLPDGQFLSDLEAFFGRRPDLPLHCRVDHVGLDLSFLESLPSLRWLVLGGCPSDLTLPPVPIERLGIDSGFQVDLSHVRALPALKVLRLSSWKRVCKLGPLAGHPTLEEGLLYDKLSGFQALASLPKLETLTLNLPKKGVPGVGPLPQVRRLTLCRASRLDLEGLETYSSLEALRLHGQKNDVDGLRSVGRVKGLKDLELIALPQMSDLSFVEGHPALRRLEIYGCRRLRSIATLATLSELRELVFRASSNASEYSGLDYEPLFNCEKLWKVTLGRTVPQSVFDRIFRPLFDRSVKVVG